MTTTNRQTTATGSERVAHAAKQGNDQIVGPLAEACVRVRQLFSRNDARDALDRYAIGCIIRDVRDGETTYGQNSVGKLARAVGRDVDTLYEYADVAETWSEIEIARLLERKTPLGLPLSFTHLVVLSKIRHRRDLLKEMTDRALTGISARHLRGILDEYRRSKKSDDSTDAQALVCLRRIVTCCDGLLAASRSFDETVAGMEAWSANPRLIALLGQARERHEQLSQHCQQHARRLDEAFERLRANLERSAAADPDGEAT